MLLEQKPGPDVEAGAKPAPAPAPAAQPAAGSCAPGSCGGKHYSCLEVIKESICGCPDHSWTPLCCNNFLDGFQEPWIAPPNGSGGAPRQTWINTFNGFFTRELQFFYELTDLNPGNRNNEHLGLFSLQTPLSRRLWLGIDIPFLVGLEGGDGVSGRVDFGDVIITPKVMLKETQNMSLSAGLGIRIPTGERGTVGDLSSLTPFVAYWSDIGGGWSLRRGIGLEIPTDNKVTPDAVFVTNVSIGQTITPHNNTPLGDFTYYPAFNMRNDLGGSDEHTLITLTPGMRNHLGNNLFFLAGWEIPVTGPRGFDQRGIFGFVKRF
jgi:hypothetical protein